MDHTSLTFVKCDATPVAAGGTCPAPCPTGCATPATTPTSYKYYYKYHLLTYGRARGLQKTTLEESGNLILTVPVKPAGSTTTSFAAWGMFIDDGTICDGSSLVPGTISGPVFTNGAWTFSTAGQYIFTDSFGSVSPKLGYQFNSSCQQSTGASYTQSGTTIAPSFASPPKLGQKALALPTNDFNQQRAVLDGVGTAGQPQNSDRNSVLKRPDQSKYPTTGASTGVFLPYTVTGGVATFAGGGIMVEGDAAVTLATIGTNQQKYTITQGKSPITTTTIVVDKLAKTTVFTSGSNSVTIQGVPSQRDSVGAAAGDPATMLYVDGNITALSGPGQGVPAVQDGNALTITAAGNIAITGDILYTKEPVTLTQNQIANTPADTLIPANEGVGVLGIFTAGGDIQLKNSQSNGNLQIDASIATIAKDASWGLINSGSDINKLTIVGGRIQNTMKNIGATTRNVYFDKRYAKGIAPPWFPSTTIEKDETMDPDKPTASFQRTQWLNQTAFQ